MPKPLPSRELLHKLLEYDPQTGRLTWRERPSDPAWSARLAGKEAFTAKLRSGYLVGDIGNTKYRAHRVIYHMMHGLTEEQEVDHRNGVVDDNRLENLRATDRTGNNVNKGKRSGLSSRFIGVSKCARSGLWRANIRIDGRAKHLGRFADEVEAAQVYDRAAAEAHAGFAQLNFPGVLSSNCCRRMHP